MEHVVLGTSLLQYLEYSDCKQFFLNELNAPIWCVVILKGSFSLQSDILCTVIIWELTASDMERYHIKALKYITAGSTDLAGNSWLLFRWDRIRCLNHVTVFDQLAYQLFQLRFSHRWKSFMDCMYLSRFI